MTLQRWRKRWKDLKRVFGAVSWYEDNKFNINLLEDTWSLDQRKIFVPQHFYLSETACPETLLTPYVKRGYDLKHVRALYPTKINVNAVTCAIAQTPGLIENNISHLEVLVTERLSEEINGELRIEEISKSPNVPGLTRKVVTIAYQGYLVCVMINDSYSPSDGDAIRVVHEWEALLKNQVIVCHLFRMQSMNSSVVIKLINTVQVYENDRCNIVE